MKANYSDLKHISRFSNRNIICVSPLKNKDWLLDLIFDRHIFESKIQPAPFKDLNSQQCLLNFPVFVGYRGKNTEMYEAVLQILKVILRESRNLRLGTGDRKIDKFQL